KERYEQELKTERFSRTEGFASRSFSQKLLTRSRARGVPRFIFVPDLATSDLYCNVHSVTSLRELSVETLLESLDEDPRQVFGSWDESRKFRWEVFNSQLERSNVNWPLRDRSYRQILLGERSLSLALEDCTNAIERFDHSPSAHPLTVAFADYLSVLQINFIDL